MFYPGTEEDLAQWRMLVEEHKTAENYGPALFGSTMIYIS